MPVTNGLLVAPDGNVPEGEEKINLKSLYEMFRDTNSHGLVSIFRCPWDIFRAGMKAPKDNSIVQKSFTCYPKWCEWV